MWAYEYNLPWDAPCSRIKLGMYTQNTGDKVEVYRIRQSIHRTLRQPCLTLIVANITRKIGTIIMHPIHILNTECDKCPYQIAPVVK